MRLTRVVYLTKTIREEFASLRQQRTSPRKLTDIFQWVYKERALDPISVVSNYLNNQRNRAIDVVNKFQDHDYSRLGGEVLAATYALKLGGRCLVQGSARWLKSNEIGLLPDTRVHDFRVEGIDLSRTVIQENGISNIENTTSLKTLIIKDCYFVDDWVLNRVAHSLSHSLENLDISNCDRVTDGGLLPLAYLKNLKTLNVSNLRGVRNKEFISMLLEDQLPGLVVSGCDHLSDDVLAQVEKQIEAELRKPDQENTKKIES